MSTYNDYLNDSLSRLRTVLDDSGSRPILFVGSGMSQRYISAPTWIELLEMLIELNPNKRFPIGYYTQDTKNDLPAVASAIVEEYQTYAWEHYGKDVFPSFLYQHSFSKSIFLKYRTASIFQDLMQKFAVENHPYQQELEIFMQLKPHAIITTNYDTLLETLFPNHSVIVGQQVIKKKEATNIGHILKIHGCVTKPEEIVISSEDYAIFHEKQKYLTAKLLTYFMEHPIVFLGYSLSDKNIKSILADIAEIVSNDGDEIVNNIWFIEWKKDTIDPDFRPPTDKTIDLGDGKSIRVNYLLVNTYERIFESLHQNSTTPVEALRELQNNIYNIIKSKSITDLEVDMVSIQNITDENILARLIGFRTIQETAATEKVTLLGIGTIPDPELLMTRYPMRISQVAERMGLSSWNYVDQIIKRIARETGFNLKETNNKYHIDIGIKQSEHRYSPEAVHLFEKVLNNEEYCVEINDRGDVVYPRKDQ